MHNLAPGGSSRDQAEKVSDLMTVQKPGAQRSQSATPVPMPSGDPVIRTIAMPADTNPSGDIFGGWIMSQMDLAAGNAAARLSQGRCATVAVEGMSFHSPVKVGDEVTVWATLIRRGRTSMTFDVQAWRRPRDGEAQACVTRAHFTFVALDDHGRPRPLPDTRKGETWV